MLDNDIKIKMTIEQWEEKGFLLFGKDKSTWRFICPVCDHICSARDYFNAANKDEVIANKHLAFNCIGRLQGVRNSFLNKEFKRGKGPCDYTGGGLFCFNPIQIYENDKMIANIFDFAQPC